MYVPSVKGLNYINLLHACSYFEPNAYVSTLPFYLNIFSLLPEYLIVTLIAASNFPKFVTYVSSTYYCIHCDKPAALSV